MGLSDWLARRRARKLSGQISYEVESFLTRLRGLEAIDLGMVAALAGDLQYRMFREGDKVDLYHPEHALLRVPDLLDGVTALGLKMQRSGFEARVPGVLVWVHTLRACRYLEVRYAAKQMWQLVEKGFPWAQAGSENLKEIIGFDAHFDLPLRVPNGFSMQEERQQAPDLKERYRKAMSLLAELLHMQRVFTGEVILVNEAKQVNAKALGYIYGLTDAAFQIAGLDIGSEYGMGVLMALIAEFDEPNADMLWDYLQHPIDQRTLMEGVTLGADDYCRFAENKGASSAPPLRWMKCFQTI